MLLDGTGIRSAEKNRISSCSLSDRIAQLCVFEFRNACPGDLHFEQTCLSGIVGLYSPPTEGAEHHLEVISLGCGTKTLAHDRLLEERERVRTGRAGTLIRDCHAEVLARRGFKRWLLTECFLVASGQSSCFVTSREGKFALKEGWTFHLYASSQPCGNASVKRWAKSKSVVSADLPPYVLPQIVHSEIHCSAVKDGEIALTVKKCPRFSADNAPEGEGGATVLIQGAHTKEKEGEKHKVLPSAVAYPGRAPFTDGVPPGVSMSCSDKILMWNTVGMQGSILCGILSSDSREVRLSSITIGRKYSEPHGMRALCCRGEFLLRNKLRCGKRKSRESRRKKEEGESGWGRLLNHPAILCTGVKLDEGSITTSSTPHRGSAGGGTGGDIELSGAQFRENRSLVAYRDSNIDGHTSKLAAEVIDSKSGLTVEGAVSAVSSAKLVSLADEIKKCEGSEKVGDGDDSASARAQYAARKAEMKSLLGHEVFGDWRGLHGDDW